MEKNKRRSEWGKGWDGRSRIPDDKFKKNYDEIDWSHIKEDKKEKKTLPPDVINQMNWVLREAKLEKINDSIK
jgi:hypothetical protein